MAAHDKASERKQGSLVLSMIFGLISALMGVFLGFVFLAAKGESGQHIVRLEPGELETYLEELAVEKEEIEELIIEGEPLPADARKPWEAYFIYGAVSPGRSFPEIEAFLQGEATGEVRLDEGTVNGWLEQNLAIDASTRDEFLDSTNVMAIVPETPNVAFRDGLVHLNVPFTFAFAGTEYEMMAFSRGELSTEGERVRFIPRDTHVNAAPLPVAPVARAVLRGALPFFREVDSFPVAMEALDNASSITIEDGAIVITP